jgi:hypothetical protein
VTLGVSTRRSSRIYAHETCSTFRCPFRFLQPVIVGHSPQRASAFRIIKCVVWCRRFRYAATGESLHRWKLGFSQSRFHHAHRTCGTSHYIPSCLAALLTCSFPLCLSTPGRSVILEGRLLSTFCSFGAISRAPKRRTMRALPPSTT